MKMIINALKGFLIMISLYTKIPVPMIEWDCEKLRYSLCFLPFAGSLLGIMEVVLFIVTAALGLSPVFFAGGALGLVILITGGIHMDGFADTMDARSSYGGIEKKQAILEDPHTGAFAVTWTSLYMILLFACMYELCSLARMDQGWGHFPLAIIAVLMLSRAVTVLAIAVTPTSRQEGMLYSVISSADRTMMLVLSLVIMVICTAALIFAVGPAGIFFIPEQLVILIYFRRMVMKGFGGISGDLCGWLIQSSELVIFMTMAVLVSLTLL